MLKFEITEEVIKAAAEALIEFMPNKVEEFTEEFVADHGSNDSIIAGLTNTQFIPLPESKIRIRFNTPICGAASPAPSHSTMVNFILPVSRIQFLQTTSPIKSGHWLTTGKIFPAFLMMMSSAK